LLETELLLLDEGLLSFSLSASDDPTKKAAITTRRYIILLPFAPPTIPVFFVFVSANYPGNYREKRHRNKKWREGEAKLHSF
jgi:hypothetical protein